MCHSRQTDQSAIFGSVASCLILCLRDAVLERLQWRRFPHLRSLVWTLGIVDDQVGVECQLHLIDGFEPSLVAFDPKVLVQ